MAEPIRAITWEAEEHSHRSGDWFWILGIVSISCAAAAILFNNLLLAIFIVIAAAILALLAHRDAEIVQYAVTTRGIRIGDQLFPYTTLEAFHIDEDDPKGPQLLIRSNKMFMHMIVIPLPEEYVDEIDELIGERLPDEFLEEPFGAKVMELFGL